MKKIFLLMLIVSESFGQKITYLPPQNRFQKSTSVGFGIGTGHYLGDIYPMNNLYSYISTVRWNITANVTREISPYLSVRLNASWIRISGDDFTLTKHSLQNSAKNDLQFLRNLSFRNDIKEISFVGLINLKDGFSRKFETRPILIPYLIAGVGLFYNKPQARNIYTTNLANWENINVSGRKSNVGISIPLGFGIRKKITDKIDITAEICYRLTFIDTIDDITATSYPPTLGGFTNRSQERFDSRTGEDRLALFNNVANRQGFPTASATSSILPPTIGFPNPAPTRGTNGNDAYWTTSMQIHYYFDKKIKCPK